MISKGQMASNKRQQSGSFANKEELRILCQQAMANTRHLEQLCLNSPSQKLPPLLQNRQPFLANITRSAINNYDSPDSDHINSSNCVPGWTDSKINVCKISFDRRNSVNVKGRRLFDPETLRNRSISNTIAMAKKSSSRDLSLNHSFLGMARSQEYSTEDLMQNLKTTQTKPHSLYPSIFTRPRNENKSTLLPNTLQTFQTGVSERSSTFQTLSPQIPPRRNCLLSAIRDTLSKNLYSSPSPTNFKIDAGKLSESPQLRLPRKKPLKRAKESQLLLEPWQRNPQEDLLSQY